MGNKVLVIGDVMIDRYIVGNAARISPEAPVPVLNVRDSYDKLGGAANVANNLVCNNVPVDIASVAGDDADGKILTALLARAGIGCALMQADATRPTTVKCRCLAQNNQQILRLDTESAADISEELAQTLADAIAERIADYGIIVLSDYLKGVLTYNFTQNVIALANKHKVPVIADIKDRQYAKYAHAYLLKPNENELRTIMNVESGDGLAEAADRLRQSADVKYVLTTLGAKGMMLSGGEKTEYVASAAKEVYDVTGAGDTVIAFLAMGIRKGKSLSDAVKFANDAAGVKVSKIGSAAVREYEVKQTQSGANKKALTIFDLPIIPRENKKVVFTNGCFDVLHMGHISSLRAAKALGDLLVVGVNSDASVKRLKGSNRPYNKQADRVELLAALEFVDYVCVFEDDTPIELIKAVRPDILVKGKDYENKEVVGRDFVESYGGKVALIDLVDGLSSTALIEKMGGDK